MLFGPTNNVHQVSSAGKRQGKDARKRQQDCRFYEEIQGISSLRLGAISIGTVRPRQCGRAANYRSNYE
jgi:hypothetical protein